MSNYICINNQRIELTDEQVERIKGSFGLSAVKLADVPVGKIVKIGSHEMIVLEHTCGATKLIRKDLLHESMEFGSNNNYDGSNVDKACEVFADEIAGIVGEGNIVCHEVDLTSDDGLKDYGVVNRQASLITADMYRHFVEILDGFKVDGYWWLATPHSTERHGNSSWVKCVSPSGHFILGIFINDYGVRPFCILKSDIFVS